MSKGSFVPYICYDCRHHALVHVVVVADVMAVLIQDYWLDVLNYSVHSKANFVLVDHGFEVLDVLVQEVEDNDRILVIDNAV